MGAKIQVDTNIWQDNNFDLATGLSYMWLFTNGVYANNIGCFNLSKKIMAFYTSLSLEEIDRALEKLCEMNLIKIDNKEVLLIEKSKFWTNSKTFVSKLYKELEFVKSKKFKQFLNDKINILFEDKKVLDKTRIEVYNKFNGRCAYCGEQIDINFFEIDHIKPRKSGGENCIENYNPSCHICNLKKSNRNLDEFRLYIGKSKDYKFYFERSNRNGRAQNVRKINSNK